MRLTDPWLLARAWLLAPALVGLGAAGIGLLVARLSGMRLGALTLPVGYLAGVALVTLVLQIELLVGDPAVILLAAAAAFGLAQGGVELRRRPPGSRLPGRPWLWAAAAALVTYALFLAPLAGSGRSGVVGYVLNNDPAVHLASIELIRDHGPVSYRALDSSFHVVSGNFGTGYPIGSYVWPMFASVLTGTDPFHLWTPLIAVSAAMIALVAFAALRQLDAPAPLAGIASALVGCSYLTYSYAAQGGAKEVAASLGVYASIVAFAAARERDFDWRGLLPAVLCVAGGIAIFGVAELAWLGPAGLAALALVVVTRARRVPVLRIARDLAAATVVFAALTVPGLIAGRRFVEASSQEVLNDVGEAGNLIAPLHWFEAFGVWLTKDYRYPFTDADILTGIGIGIAAVLGAVGVAVALRRRRFAVPIALLAAFGAVLLVVVRGRHGIYLDAKVYALLAPALGLAAAAGVVALYRARNVAVRGLGLLLGVALGAGILVSDALVYTGAWMTPKERFAEMIDLDARYAGRGPVLVHEHEEYAKHLLRDVDPWMSWDSYQPERGFLLGPVPPAIPHVPDFDDYHREFYDRFPLLFERKRPAGSRPPGNYTAIEETRHYRVWERTGPTPQAHLALGNGDTIPGTARLDCALPEYRELLALARRSGRPLRVAYGERVVIRYDYQWLAATPVQAGPQPNFNYRLGGSSDIATTLEPGRWRAWIEGSFGPGHRLSLRQPGTLKVGPQDKIGEVRADLGIHDGFQTFGEFDVDRRRQVFQLLGLDKPIWQAGSRRPDLVGPVAFTPATSTRRIVDVDPADARELCGQRLDWIEVP
jgi:hypothetical protein